MNKDSEGGKQALASDDTNGQINKTPLVLLNRPKCGSKNIKKLIKKFFTAKGILVICVLAVALSIFYYLVILMPQKEKIIQERNLDKVKTEIGLLYQDIFDRMADENEVNFWVDKSDYSIDDIKRTFFSSAEYEKKIILLEDRYNRQHALKTLYQDFFRDIVEINGKDLEDWKKDDVNILGVKFYFLNSDEYRKEHQDQQDTKRLDNIAYLYWTVFRRKPDKEGLMHWDQNNLSIEQIREKLLQNSEFSDLLKEYENKRGRGPAFEFLFEAVFNRAADSGSYNNYVIEKNEGNLLSVKEELLQMK